MNATPSLDEASYRWERGIILASLDYGIVVGSVQRTRPRMAMTFSFAKRSSVLNSSIMSFK
jgi:hypothetical protein